MELSEASPGAPGGGAFSQQSGLLPAWVGCDRVCNNTDAFYISYTMHTSMHSML